MAIVIFSCTRVGLFNSAWHKSMRSAVADPETSEGGGQET